MSSFPNCPRAFKCGIVVTNAESSAVRRIMVLQYNPERLTLTLRGQGRDGKQRSLGGSDIATPVTTCGQNEFVPTLLMPPGDNGRQADGRTES